MPYRLHKPLIFSNIGQRAINQDVVYPGVEMGQAHDRLFLVCDGMGGADRGEVASRLLCEAVIGTAAREGFVPLNQERLGIALQVARQSYKAFMQEHPTVSRMGSTLAFLQLHAGGATVAHIGDSRVYLIRNGQVIFCTRDHRQVADLVAEGIITPQQAQSHPWRNRLSRAMYVENGHTDSRLSDPDITLLTDLQPGDYFLLCSDGVLEQLSEPLLEAILSHPNSPEEKLNDLLSVCEGHTRDNYSGILVQLEDVLLPQTASRTDTYS